MSYSLKISHGDFDVSGTRLATVTGTDKLLQDLRIALLVGLGRDRYHPVYGSHLEEFIGTRSEQIQGRLTNEIRRIATGVQSAQLARLQADKTRFNKATLTASEILVAVTSVDVRIFGDTVTAKVGIQNGAGQVGTLSLTLSDLLGLH